MSVVINGTTGITAAAFDGAVDAADLTGTLPALDGSALTNLSAGNLTGNVAAARITNALNASGSAPIYACRAWVNFNGTGTVAIRASGNVSSITDNGTGDYTVNFTTAMPDANYSATASTDDVIDTTTPPLVNFVSLLAGSARFKTIAAGAKTATRDMSVVSIAIFR